MAVALQSNNGGETVRLPVTPALRLTMPSDVADGQTLGLRL